MAALFVDLAQTCAPAIAVETLAAVISLESRFQPFDIRINSGPPLPAQPRSKAEAIESATALIAGHQDVQLGLGGIGIEELRKLGLTISDAFDPCLNLKATATLLDGYYRLAVRAGAPPGQAETVMLQSYYGRADPSVGQMAQYDEQVRRELRRLSRKLGTLTIAQRAAPQTSPETEANVPSSDGKTELPQQRATKAQSWDVFSAARRSSALVFQNDQSEELE